MSEQSLIQAMESPTPEASPADVAKVITGKLQPNRPDRAARQAERAAEAAAEKAAPKLSRSERLAAEDAGMTADEVLAAERRERIDPRTRSSNKDALTSERDDEDAEELEREGDVFDKQRVEKAEDKAEEPEEDPLFRDPNKDPANPYNLPEETEFTDKSGKTYKIPRELVEGALRQADYTRSKQEVAEIKRSSVAEKAMLTLERKITTELAPAIAQVHNLRQTAEQLRNQMPDPEQDPLGYIKLDKQIRDREAAASQLERAIADKRTEYATQQQSLQTELLHSGVEWLKRTTKGNWTQQIQQQVGQYAVSQGFTPEELTANFDPRFVLMAYKAMQYERRQTAPKPIPAEKRREARPVPIPKPSAPVQSSRPGKDPAIAEYRQRAQRTGNINDVGDALAALFDRSRRR